MTDKQKASIQELLGRLSLHYETDAQLQSLINILQYEIYRLQGVGRQYEEDEAKAKKEMEEKIKEKNALNEHMPVLKSTLPNLTTPSLIKEYETMIFNGKTEQAKLEKWMERNHPNQLNENFLKYHRDQGTIEYYTAMGVSICEWFAEGNGGTGTVTFMDKEYKAS